MTQANNPSQFDPHYEEYLTQRAKENLARADLILNTHPLSMNFVVIHHKNKATGEDTTMSVRYDHFVEGLFKQQTVPLEMLHAALGICGEAGEFADAVKKHVIYNKPLDKDNIREELGDLLFYIEAAKKLFNLSDQEILQANADKLSKRYVDLKYSDESAVNRLDKALEAQEKQEHIDAMNRE